MSLGISGRLDDDGNLIVTDRAVRCDVPGCEAIRNVIEFRDRVEAQQALPTWHFGERHLCPTHAPPDVP